MAELHDLQPTSRFTDRASEYARHRPGYPSGLVDALVADGPKVAVDIGAGTGISSRLLAARGVRVIAVEPNAAMREAAGACEGVAWVEATGERTGLESSSVDLVLCAQSFHWLRAEEALAEFARVLRPGGVVALVWNDRDDQDEFTREYGRLLRVASGDHPAMRGVPHHESLRRSRLFEGFETRVFPSSQGVTREGLLGRARSASYCPREGEAWERLLEGLIRAHAAHADAEGVAALVYVSSLHTARRV